MKVLGLSRAAPRLAGWCWQVLLLLPERREESPGSCPGRGSEGGDVIERVVQLLTDGLVLHLLGIDFIWGPRGRGKRRVGAGVGGMRQGKREGDGERTRMRERDKAEVRESEARE